MAIAAEVFKTILQEILVHGAESELEAVEFQDVLFATNNYMTALDAKGVHLGYTIVTDLGDEITIPPGAVMGLIKNVALTMISQFGATADQQLRIDAKFGMEAMRELGISLDRMLYPSTLPRGSGNEGRWRSGRRFYRGVNENTVGTETGNSISLEDNT